jgi:hypothetical protein
MLLTVDLDSLELIAAATDRRRVSLLETKRGGKTPLEITFVRSGVAELLPTNSVITLSIKEDGKHDDNPVVSHSTFSTPGDNTGTYDGEPSFNTTELNALFNIDGDSSNDVSMVNLMGELSWAVGAAEPTKIRTFTVRVHNDVHRDSDGTPTSQSTPDEWLVERGGAVSVKAAEYGAVGDGVTDDTVAIQAAMDSGSPVFFPAGSYLISAALEINRNQLEMFAVGMGSAKIVQDTDDEDGIVNGGDYSYFSMEGIWVEGPGSGTSTGKGLDLSGQTTFTMRHQIRRCFLTDFATGLKTGDTVLFRAQQCQFASNKTDVDLDGADTVWMDTVGTGTSFGGGATANLGWKIANNHAVTLKNLDCGNTVQLMTIEASVVSIEGANIEEVTGDKAIHVKPTGRLRIGSKFRVLNATGPTVNNSAFICLEANSGFEAELVMDDTLNISTAGNSWRPVVCVGSGSYYGNIRPVYNGHTIGLGVYYCSGDPSLATTALTQNTAKGAGRTPLWHRVRWQSGMPAASSYKGQEAYLTTRDDDAYRDEHLGKSIRNRTGSYFWSDLVPENHFKVLTYLTAADAGTPESALATVAVAGRTLFNNGESLRLEAFGKFAANQNGKQIRCTFGGTGFFSTQSLMANDEDWALEVVIVKTGSSSWASKAVFSHGSSVMTETYEGAGTTLTAAQNLILYGVGAVAADVEMYAGKVRWDRTADFW